MELGESQLLLMRMIVGHGIDIEELASIAGAVERHDGFVKRVLTGSEMERFNSLKGRKQIEFLAGRWSAKEAFAKALGTGIGKLSFQDLEVFEFLLQLFSFVFLVWMDVFFDIPLYIPYLPEGFSKHQGHLSYIF